MSTSTATCSWPRTRGPGSSSSTAFSFLLTAPAWVSKRYLILAEGRSGDPHYGKTARGVIRYAPDPTVALLDSTRAGETQDEIPIVGSVDKALRFEPTTAIVGGATQGGRFPPAWRELLTDSIEAGPDAANGPHDCRGDDP